MTLAGKGKQTKKQPAGAKLKLSCEYCDCDFEHEFKTPLAVTCECCGSTFDARLQLVKAFRGEFEKITHQR